MNRRRIVLLSSCDGLASLAASGLLEHNDDAAWEVAGVVRASMPLRTQLRLAGRALRAGALPYLVFMQAEIAGLALANRLHGKPIPLLPRLVRTRGIPLLETRDPNGPEARAFIRGRNADLVLSVRPGHILRRRLLEAIPPVINLHCSALPKYRGIAAVMRALAAGDPALGCTLHRVLDESIDAGPIVLSSSLRANPAHSVLLHTIRLYLLAGALLRQLAGAPTIAEGALAPADTPYHSWPGRAERRGLRERGVRMMRCADFRRLPTILSAARRETADSAP